MNVVWMVADGSSRWKSRCVLAVGEVRQVSLLSHVRRHARPDLTERLNLNRTRGIPA